jgi:hypothetical protein
MSTTAQRQVDIVKASASWKDNNSATENFESSSATTPRSRRASIAPPDGTGLIASNYVEAMSEFEPAKMPGRARPVSREELLQEWEGRVVEIRADQFTARLVDLSAGDNEERDEVDILISDLAAADLELLRENSIFRWLIGYRYFGSTKERFTRVVFRRMPAWSRNELRAARRSAEQRAERMVWD